MKKSLIILCLFTLMVCGCEKKNNDNSVSSTSSTTTTKEMSTSASTSTTTSTTTKSTKTTKTTIKQSTITCREKKFDKKYSYAYKTKEECMKKGNEAFSDISDNVNKEVFAYDCRLIKDECGNSWYGAYFYVYNRNTSKEEVYY